MQKKLDSFSYRRATDVNCQFTIDIFCESSFLILCCALVPLIALSNNTLFLLSNSKLSKVNIFLLCWQRSIDIIKEIPVLRVLILENAQSFCTITNYFHFENDFHQILSFLTITNYIYSVKYVLLLVRIWKRNLNLYIELLQMCSLFDVIE